MRSGRPPFPNGFGLFLEEAKVLESDLYPDPLQYQTVVTETLPDHILVEGLGAGFLVFDFSANPSYNGGAIPEGLEFTDLKYQKAADERNKIALKRAKFMNAFVATLHAGGQDSGHGFIAQPPTHIGNYLFASKYENRWSLTGPCSNSGDRSIPAKSITEAANYMNKIHNAYGPDTVELLSLLQGATFHFANHDFSSCLVTGWSVVEVLQNKLWLEYINKSDLANGGFTEFNSDRRQQLNGRDFTASVVSQILSLANVIDDATLKQMNAARKARNDFAHSLKPVGHEVAFTPVRLAATMIGKKAGCNFRIGGGFSWHN